MNFACTIAWPQEEAAAEKCHWCSMLQGTVSCNGICWQGQCKPSVQSILQESWHKDMSGTHAAETGHRYDFVPEL